MLFALVHCLLLQNVDYSQGEHTDWNAISETFCVILECPISCCPSKGLRWQNGRRFAEDCALVFIHEVLGRKMLAILAVLTSSVMEVLPNFRVLHTLRAVRSLFVVVFVLGSVIFLFPFVYTRTSPEANAPVFYYVFACDVVIHSTSARFSSRNVRIVYFSLSKYNIT